MDSLKNPQRFLKKFMQVNFPWHLHLKILTENLSRIFAEMPLLISGIGSPLHLLCFFLKREKIKKRDFSKIFSKLFFDTPSRFPQKFLQGFQEAFHGFLEK